MEIFIFIVGLAILALTLLTYIDYLVNRCKHVLKDKKEIQTFEINDAGQKVTNMPFNRKLVKECTKCGTIKIFTT